MSICETNYLINRDSITMAGYMSKGFEEGNYNDTCNGDAGSVVSFPFFHNEGRYDSYRSMIIVNNRAALVLENGSYTHLDANSTILVKKGGTLYIQDGATVEIGGLGRPGYAEIIVEDSAFLCIEQNANISFYKGKYDSSDKNVFYIANGYGYGTSIAGKNPIGGSGIFSGGGPYFGGTCTPLCSLTNYGFIENKEYGWFSLGKPFAHIESPDTVCIGDTLAVHALYTLNESRFQFKICEYDTLMDTCITIPVDLNTCDTGRVAYCNLTQQFPWIANRSYKLTLEVYNQCGEMDDTFKIIYTKAYPTADFTLTSDTACPGIGTVIADGSGSSAGYYHVWTVTAIEPYVDVPEDYEEDDKNNLDSVYTVTGAVSDEFDFPGFRFKGGKDYIITLRVTDFCGTTGKIDTVHIPLGAEILNDTPALVYGNGIGPDSLWLEGEVFGTDTFQWLSKPLSGGSFTVISGADSTSLKVGPSQDYIYVLRAWSGPCEETDTIIVHINLYAYAGRDTVICRGDSAQLGVSGITLPSGYTALWETGYALGDSTDTYTKAGPDSTVVYKLKIFNDSEEIESDEITVYVDSLPAAEFDAYSDEPYKICFDNLSVPYSPATSYKWFFGDGDSSSLAKPCHTYPYVGFDTVYVVCLTITNTCGDSTFCDSLYIFEDSAYYTSNAIAVKMKEEVSLKENKRVLNYPTDNLPNISSLTITKVVPNPTSGLTRVYYRLGKDADPSYLNLYNFSGASLKSYRLTPHTEYIDIDLSYLPSAIYVAMIHSPSDVSRPVKIILAK